MNSFNTQLQIEDMYDYDEYAALLGYCEQRQADEDTQGIHWENVWMEVNNEYQDNQPQLPLPW